MIDFKNLIIGKHEGRVVFVWNTENGAAVLGAFLDIKDGIEDILARCEITPAQRAILEDLRTLAGRKNWDFATLRESFL
jgi:L-arabinose isomerase